MAEELTHCEDLDATDKALLAREILSVEIVGDYFIDDHEPCIELRIVTPSRIVEAGFWWCGVEFIAAAIYANDSAKAKADLTNYIRERIQA